MADKLLGDNLVLSLHLDLAETCANKAKELLERNAFGEAKHEIGKVIRELSEAKDLFNRINAAK